MKGEGVKKQCLQVGHGPNTLLTWSKWIAFSLLHCVSLSNVVELWQPPKLLPYSVVVEKGPHGIVNIPNKALWKSSGHQGQQTQAPSPWVKHHHQPQGKDKASLGS